MEAEARGVSPTAADMAEDNEDALKDRMSTLQTQIFDLQASVRQFITKPEARADSLIALRALDETFRQQAKENRNRTTPNVATETVDTMQEHEGE